MIVEDFVGEIDLSKHEVSRWVLMDKEIVV